MLLFYIILIFIIKSIIRIGRVGRVGRVLSKSDQLYENKKQAENYELRSYPQPSLPSLTLPAYYP